MSLIAQVCTNLMTPLIQKRDPGTSGTAFHPRLPVCKRTWTRLTGAPVGSVKWPTAKTCFFLCPENSFGRFIQRCKKLRIYELLWISRFAMSKLTSETQKCKNLCVFTVTPASVLACLNPWAASPSNRSFTKHIVELTESVDVFSNKTGLGGTVLGTHHRTMVNRGHWPSESNNSAQVLKTFNSQWIVLNYEVSRRAQLEQPRLRAILGRGKYIPARELKQCKVLTVTTVTCLWDPMRVLKCKNLVLRYVSRSK